MRVMTCVNSSASCVDCDDALQRVAADAIQQEILLFVRAGHAHEPFGIGHLRDHVFCFHELQIGGRGFLRGKIGRCGSFEIVADRANLQGVMAGLQAARRESCNALCYR